MRASIETVSRSTAAGTALLIGFLLAADTALAQTPGRVTRASVDSLGGESIGSAQRPSLSADGRFVVFESDAPDLVPGDTNGDTDVFLRDRVTGVVERVSLAWNGMEARDDSGCASVSDDGRFVAFQSLAWNMYPGGANLGEPFFDVYLRDRQAGTTLRLSTPRGGGAAIGDSLCPSLSGDGRRVVFESAAPDLVAGDDGRFGDVFLYDTVRSTLRRITKAADGGDADGESRRPVISRNGRFVAFESRANNLRETGVPQPPLIPYASTVFVRDLDAGLTEAVSLKDAGNDGYPYSPQENSWAPSISDDGRFVSFVSDAWNLVVPTPLHRLNVFVRDRQERRTLLATPSSPPQEACGRDGDTFPCARAKIVTARISGDGRFVAISTRSSSLLPVNQYHGEQIYLFDVDGRRLRRLSVEESGWESDSCSVDPALSADGRVLAYRSTATNLIADDENGRADVFVHDWTCDDAGRCRTLAACPASPVACAPATGSLLRLSKRPPGGVKQDQLFWRWSGDASAPAFPDPLGGARYQLCVYAASLSLDLAAPAAPACAGGTRPCWQTLGSGHKLIDGRGGLSSLRVSTGGGTPRILVRGAGSLLDAPYLPLDGSNGLVVQLQETTTGSCWGAELPASAIRYNVSGPAERGTGRNGKLVAQLR